MPYEAMVDGYIALYKRLLTDREIALRIRNKLRFLGAPIYGGGYSTRKGSASSGAWCGRASCPAGRAESGTSCARLPLRAPSQLPTVISDWIVGLSMQEFAERRLTVEQAEASSLERRVDFGAQRHRRVRGGREM